MGDVDRVRKKPTHLYHFPKGLGDHFRSYLSWSGLQFQAMTL